MNQGDHMLDLLFGGRSLIFESRLSVEDATMRLQREITTPEWRMRENRRQLFMGTFADGRFRIFRLASSRNSFKPTIDGTLSAAVNGCHVNARLKMAPMDRFSFGLLTAVGVTLLLFGLQAVITLVDPAGAVTEATVVELLALFMAPLMLVGPLVTLFVETRKATRTLAALLESQPARSTTKAVARQSEA